MKINYNISAIIANNSLTKSDNRLSVSSEKLSSGYKINHAKDDPSGIAIGKKMRAQIKALEQSNQNAGDAISIVEITDGALSEVHAIVQRMNELAIKASTGTATPDDRKILDEELQQLKEEVERIGRDTEFNGQSLLDGTFDRKGYSSEADVDVTYFSDLLPAGEYTLEYTMGTVDGETVVTGATLTGTTATGADYFMTNAQTDIDETSVRFYSNDGKEIVIEVDPEAAGGEVTLDLTDIGPMRVQIGSNEGQVVEIRIPELSLLHMGMEDTNVLTIEDAQEAIVEISNGLEYVSSLRSRLGAYQNRLEHTTNNLDVTTLELTSAYSRIMDTDMAEEMTEYTNLQVLVQAGTSILAQANERPQQALQLLQ